jgi:hypothetical protein
VFPEAFLALLGAVEPTVADPVLFTDGPVVGPLIPVVAVPVVGTPVLCASAKVLESAKAVASAIVASFMGFPSCRFDTRQPHRHFYRSLNSSLSATEAAKPFTSRSALMLQQSSSIACHSTFSRLDFARSLERFGVHSINRVRRFA